MEKFIIVIAILHSYVFGFMFFTKKRLSNRILGFYMMSFFVQSFLFGNFHIFKIDVLNPLFYLLISGLSLCDFPMIYLYVKMMADEKYKFNYRSLFHFIPGAFFLILQFVLFFSLNSNEKHLLFLPKEMTYDNPILSGFFSSYSISILLLFVQVFYYSFLMIRTLIKHQYNIEKYYSYKDKLTLNWLFIFVILYLLYYVFEITIFIFRFIDVSETFYFSIVSLHIFFVGIFGLKQREIYLQKEIEENPKENILELSTSDTSTSELSETIKEESSEQIKKHALLPVELKNEIAEKIKNIMDEKQIFLNPELSLDDMSLELNVHKNYISYVINDTFNINFYNFVNQYRIIEAKKMLSNPKFNKLSIEGIAKSCGYKSRNVFYPIFKKLEGITPLEYKNKVQGLSKKEE